MSDAGSDFKKGVYANAVIQAAEKAGVRLAPLTVLYYLCKWMKKTGPLVDQSRGQIEAACGLHRETVQLAIRTLKAMGVIIPVANQKGGRLRGLVGKPVVYRITIIGRENTNQGDGNSDIKGTEIPTSRGRKFHPPNTTNIIQRKTDRGAAVGGGGERCPLDEKTLQEQRLFSREHREHGLAKAMELKRQREAQAAGAEFAMSREGG